MSSCIIQSIGVLKTPFEKAEGTPIQPLFAKDSTGTLILEDCYAEGLQGLEAFSHIWVIYAFDRNKKTQLKVVPFMGDEEVGVYATRSPTRPNNLGMTLLRIDSVDGNVIHVSGVDMLNNTPVFDIKPFFGNLEVPTQWETGWLDEDAMSRGEPRLADDRFL